ncbi:MAG: indole-3-glycerol phosphate synthase TrpC [Planctomycetes bacterium]|nr:indole-3-glycerol phosphate synthase TrpC [Planctomycetota bacterium]
MSFLSAILDHKRAEVQRCRESVPIEAMPSPVLPARDFAAALGKPGVSVIAEIKRKSPSRGFMAEHADAAKIASSYDRGGAAAISVLTDQHFFGAASDDLITAKRATSLPILRKDFIIDPYQIHQSVHMGADAVLLIVAVLNDSRLSEFIRLAGELGLQTLVEVHTEQELEQAIAADAPIIGVNSRDLTTFAIDPKVCQRLRPFIPADRLAVAESGIQSQEDVSRLADAGYDAVLVGRALMEATDPARRLEQLTGRVLTKRGTQG